MDPKQYINSGKLEQYVLGLSETSAERQEVERYAREYPEIRAEINEIEIALEAFALANAKPVSSEILQRLMEEIRNQASNPVNTATNTPPTTPPASGGSSLLPWVVSGLLGLLAVFLYFTGQSAQSDLETRNEDLQAQFTTLQDDCDASNTALERSQERNLLLTNPATSSVLLGGTDGAPDSKAIVFHNTELDQTIFRATNLPTPPAGRQYQLWAIDGEGPKSIAVLDLDLAEDTLLTVEYISGAATFAITLEELGGKDSPDLSQLQVIGNI